VIRKTVHGDTKTRAGVRLVRGQAPLTDFEYAHIIGLKNMVAIETKLEPRVSIMRSVWATRDQVSVSKVLSNISFALKKSSGDQMLRPHHLRHSAATRWLLPSAISSNPNLSKLQLKMQNALGVSRLYKGLLTDTYPLNVATQLGHSNPMVSLKWYVSLRESLDSTNHSVLENIKDKTLAEIIGVEPKQYSQRQRRLKKKIGSSDHSVVYRYCCDANLPSLIDSKYDAYPKPRNVDSKSLVDDVKAIHIIEVLLSIDISPEEIKNAKMNIADEEVERILSFKHSFDSRFKYDGILSFERENIDIAEELMTCRRTHTWLIEFLPRLSDIFQTDEAKKNFLLDLHFVLIYSRNQKPAIVVDSKISLETVLRVLQLMNIENKNRVRFRSTKKDVAKEFNGKHNKNSANKTAFDKKLRNAGCEVVIDWPEEIKKTRTFLKIASVLWIILQAL